MTIGSQPMMIGSSLWATQRLLNQTFQCTSVPLVVTNEPLHQISVTIENERLGNVLIVFQISIYQLVIGKPERILNLEFLCKPGNLFAIVIPADIETNDLKSLRLILSLHLNQTRCLIATGLAPRRIEVEHHHLAQIVRKSRALIILKRPSVGARSIFRSR